MKNFFKSLILPGVLLLTACSTDNTSETTLKKAYSDSFMIGCAVNPLLWNRDYTPHKALNAVLAVPED